MGREGGRAWAGREGKGLFQVRFLATSATLSENPALSENLEILLPFGCLLPTRPTSCPSATHRQLVPPYDQ